MKALTLSQPWASLVVIGAKRIETRSWSTRYRVPLAIHAAKRFPLDRRVQAYFGEPFRTVLAKAHLIPTQAHGMVPENLPLGMIVATCNLVTCTKIYPGVSGIEIDLDGMDGIYEDTVIIPPDEPERSFGDYTPGRYAWILADVQPLAKPVPAKGALGLWVWNDA